MAMRRGAITVRNAVRYGASHWLWHLLVRTHFLDGRGILLGTLIGCVAVALQLVCPLIAKYLIDDVIVARREAHLAVTCALLVFAAAAAAALTAWQNVVFASASATGLVRLRCQVLSHLRSLPHDRGAEIPRGDVLSYFTSDSAALAKACESLFSCGVPNVIRLIGAVVLVALADPNGIWLGLGAVALFGTIAACAQGSLDRAARGRQTSEAVLNNELAESLTTGREIVAFNGTGHEQVRWTPALEGCRRAQVQWARANQLAGGAGLVYWVLVAIAYYAGGSRVIDGQLTIGALTALVAYLGMIQSPVAVFVSLGAEVGAVRQAGRRLDALFRRQPQLPLITEKAICADAPLNNDIECEHLSVCVGGRLQVLHDVTFRIPSGQSVAIVGASGAGKTTLLRAMLRLVDPVGGRILLGGVDIQRVPPSVLRDRISIVFQDPQLLTGTVAANILLGVEADKGRAEEAARLAHADEFIKTLPLAYVSQVHNSAVPFSIGQIQRLALARAFARRPGVLLLDEVTAALDPASALLVQDTLVTALALEGVTRILVTHKIEIARRCDAILVLDRGRLVGSGVHASLCRTCPQYRRLIGSEREPPSAARRRPSSRKYSCRAAAGEWSVRRRAG